MKPLTRDYHLTDPSLVLKSEDTLDSIDRDITEFNARGFTPLKRTAFENAITALDGMPSDNYLLGQQEIKTGAKDTVRVTCETKINLVLTAVVNVWGIDSPEYHLFTEDVPLSKLSDSDLLRFMEDFAESTTDFLTELADEGITAGTVTEITDLRTEFNNALKAQRKAIKERNTGNNARITKGNALYELLVKYCNTGKNIWLNVDESKYNDYVIYETPSGNLQQTIPYSVNPMSSLVLVNIPYRANRHFTIHNSIPVPCTIFMSADGVSQTGISKPVSGNGTVSTVCVDLAPSGDYIMVRNDNPGVIDTGTFTYDL